MEMYTVWRSSKVTTGVLLCTALILAGCGSAKTASTGSTVIRIPFKSGFAGGMIPAKYTCDGKDLSPPLEWGAVPSETSSLVLLVIGAKPEPATHTEALSVEWAVAGLNPNVHRLAAGQRLPRGNIGIASDGKQRYSICPARGSYERYQFALYGLATASVAPDFSGIELLKLLDSSKRHSLSGFGEFVSSYTRH
jgi:phosphatidylethanolamine-binding protein (PEBP) family uncharacterized protein